MYFIRIAAAGACMIYLGTVAWAAADQAVSPAVEQAVLAENWTQVVTLLKEVTPQTPSPVLRLIKGHACLAVNRNNEALCLFMSVADKSSQETWENWTKELAKKNSQKAGAYYLYGDALARQGRLNEAQAAFNQGLQLSQNHSLILNARGVVLALNNKWTEAKDDLTKAGNNPQMPLADAYVNLGGMFIHRKDGAKGAVRAFNQALTISPEYCLALLGRGCVELVLNQMSDAEKDLKNAQKLAGCAKPLVDDTALDIFALMTGMKKEDLLAMSQGKKAGTVFDVKFEDVKKSYDAWKQNPSDQKLYNKFHTQASQLPPNYQQQITTMMKNDTAKDPALSNRMQKCESVIYSHNNHPVTQLVGDMIKDTAKAIGGAIAAGGTAATATGAGAPPGVGAIAVGTGIAGAGQIAGKTVDNTTKANADFSNQVFKDVFSKSGSPTGPLGGGGGAAWGPDKTMTMKGPGGPGGPGGPSGGSSSGFDKTPASKGAGGVDISFKEAAWDEGDWPFKAHFGLLYQ